MTTNPASATSAPTAAAPAQAAVAAGSPAGFHLPSYLLGLLTALILIGAALFFWPRPQAPAVQLQAPPTLAAPAQTPAAAAAQMLVEKPAATAAPTPGPLVVFVSGAVVQPGLYRLAPGARVGDALTAAGGLLPQVDMALINQAQPLVDGAQLHVPAPTELSPLAANPAANPAVNPAVNPADSQANSQAAPEAIEQEPALSASAQASAQEPAAGLSVPPALPTPTPLEASTEASTEASPARAAVVDLPDAGGLINVNTATNAELESLPAIGPAKAQAIIANRPYATVDELDRVPGIGPATLEQIRPLVTTE